ncbi:MAG: thioredoxin domain-containing protein [Lachnospiraceae bacterium]|nr:thioredoxin domain-containing protein [Lachnospiraceae bacterium]
MLVKRYSNRLIHEKSPYLLQHAHNPVDWYPWGEEAFKKAQAEDKPIFLSIGYSTCHWCHVMAHESFEDVETAAALNKDFICIKVDREERPDIDAVYMSACQTLTGSGGWPLTILMTPEQKPFWAGTYLPKISRYGLKGLLDLLDAAAGQWKENREKLIAAGDEITAMLNPEKSLNLFNAVGKKTLHEACSWFKQSYDERWGGFGYPPKFPSPHNMLFLLVYADLEKEPKARNMVEHSMEQMYRGGIFDHIGGGFSRYSTDEKWLVPHFEKMLYDNALLVGVSLETYHQTRRPLYCQIVERTIGYVLHELTDKDGGFYCGQDADSDGVEGKYYVFSPEEIRTVLGLKDGDTFCRWFGITETGNFEGKSIPNLIENPKYEEESPLIKGLCEKLYEYRLRRTQLHKDDKVLTAWNALMIAALADAWRLLKVPAYLNAAEKAWGFITEYLTDCNQRLLHRWRDGEAARNGQLDDYAFAAFALLKLYDATFNADYLEQAIKISGQMIEHFFDEEKGGFFLYANDSEQLISRPKEVYDGAMPSGNSIAAATLVWLSRFTGEKRWNEYGEKQLAYLAGHVQQFPAGYSAALLAFMQKLYPSRELVCVTTENQVITELQKFLQENNLSLLSTLVKTRENQFTLAKAAPFTKEYPFPKNGTAYYLCTGGACAAPVYNLQELKLLIS